MFCFPQVKGIFATIEGISVKPCVIFTCKVPLLALLPLSQASYGKGPDYFLLKTEIFPVSVFLYFSALNSILSWKIISMTVFNKDDSYLSLFITAHVQDKEFL